VSQFPPARIVAGQKKAAYFLFSPAFSKSRHGEKAGKNTRNLKQSEENSKRTDKEQKKNRKRTV